MLAEVQPTDVFFHWSPTCVYLLTLGILPHVPLMIAEVYYNMITLPYKGSLLEYKPCSNGQGLCAFVGLFKSTTLYAHIKLRVRWNRGSSING